MVEESQQRTDISSILSGGILVSGSKIISITVGYLVQIAMARFLTESGYGQVILVLSIINMATFLANSGLDDGIMRKVPIYEDDNDKLSGVIWAALQIGFVSSILISLGLFVLSPIISDRIFDIPELSTLIRLAVISIPFTVLTGLTISISKGIGDAKPHAYVRQIARPVGRLLFIGGLVLLGFASVGAIIGHAIAIITCFFLSVALIWDLLSNLNYHAKARYKEILYFSIPLLAFQGVNFLNSNIDIYMVGYFLNSEDVGIYNVSLQIGNVLNSLISSIAFLLPPTMAKLDKKENYVRMIQIYRDITKYMVLVAIPIFILLFLFTEPIVRLSFGSNYLSGTESVRIILLGSMVSFIFGLPIPSLIGVGRKYVVLYITILQVSVNSILNYLLVPTLGITGAAIGLAVSTFIGGMVAMGILYNEFGLHTITPKLLSIIVSAIPVCFIYYTIPYDGLFSFALMAPVIFIYCLLLVALFINSSDMELLQSLR
ncbi:flippase [Halorubrum sp. AS12]|uniref:flippase n=1 Tax=Halorubrum sp. AS12 TaxID=3409687 RepID=UPI003DA6DEAF